MRKIVTFDELIKQGVNEYAIREKERKNAPEKMPKKGKSDKKMRSK